jgi:hypothetical protein
LNLKATIKKIENQLNLSNIPDVMLTLRAGSLAGQKRKKERKKKRQVIRRR